MIQEQVRSGSWRESSILRIVEQICVGTLEIGLRVSGWGKATWVRSIPLDSLEYLFVVSHQSMRLDHILRARSHLWLKWIVSSS